MHGKRVHQDLDMPRAKKSPRIAERFL